jgi:phosphohistidine phosphatase
MEIYILRHGIAVERGTRGYAKGEEKMRQIAAALVAMGLNFDLILSSRLIRAQQTAEIVAEELDKETTFTDFLAPGANALELIAEINDEKPQRVLLVGHEPDLSELISMLITGTSEARIEFKKGGLCKLTSDRLTFGQCATLNWLLTPKQLRSIR